jgi:hypothetical protein
VARDSTEVHVSSDRRTALVAGGFFLITFATAIPALYLFQPVLDDPVIANMFSDIAHAALDPRIRDG